MRSSPRNVMSAMFDAFHIEGESNFTDMMPPYIYSTYFKCLVNGDAVSISQTIYFFCGCNQIIDL